MLNTCCKDSRSAAELCRSLASGEFVKSIDLAELLAEATPKVKLTFGEAAGRLQVNKHMIEGKEISKASAKKPRLTILTTPRERRSTVVEVETHERGLGKMMVSRSSILAEQKEFAEQAAREAASLAKQNSGPTIKWHESSCCFCRQSIADRQKHLQMRTIKRSDSRRNLLVECDLVECSRCPRALHLSCLQQFSEARYNKHMIGATLSAPSCPQHNCQVCFRGGTDANGLLMCCINCPLTICWECLEAETSDGSDVWDSFQLADAFADTAWRGSGYKGTPLREFMNCPDCRHRGFHLDLGSRCPLIASS
eukprot:TRINITY_DN31768_c0_g1_i1.p1 TRINITY_DN31768_c0_g1~~TRINITY_DN31768_c0_g1_i1.p1  ORF type:complete len:310 (+),score=50.03 TRINITY_DN31768_c0_g1_i1:1297-2226(+)